MIELNYTDLGLRIRKYRELKGITQTVLAEEAGCEPTTISHIERGTSKVSLPLLVNITNALDTTLDTLMVSSIENNSEIIRGEFGVFVNTLTPVELKKALTMLECLVDVLRH